MRRLAVSHLIAAFLPLQAFAACHVTGRILGAGGEPLPLAHAHLLSYRGTIRQPLQAIAAAKDGRFALTIPELGMYRLFFTGVGHDNVSIPLLLESEKPELDFTVYLAPLSYKEQFEVVRIVGDWNAFKWDKADTMRRQPDGSFVYECETAADTVAYQLLDITASARSVNGTASDWFRYDGGGDYISVLRTRAGKARIVFDPAKLQATKAAARPSLEVHKGDGSLRPLWAIDTLVQKQQEAFQLALMKYREQHLDTRGFSYDWSATVARLKKYLTPDQDPLVRRFAALRLAWLGPFGARLDSAALNKIVELLPSDSPMWALEPQAALVVHRDPQRQERFVQELAEKNPDRTVRAMALAVLASMAQFKKDSSALAGYYARLEQEYSDVQEVEYYLKTLNPRRRITTGKPVPDFAVQLMDNGLRLSNRDLLGKFYLLDFWATWCGPCVGEMPHLHDAYERFKEKGFVILSLSLDRAPEDVTTFRQKRWVMPWLHTFLDEGVQNEITHAFEVTGIPKPILVGPDGIILAVEGELRGQNLHATLAKHMGQ
ncbi:MAG: thioredoxin-like domain-containing protein [candidate division KSB1 bacterium]|nr:thioredoxin-like domain-containing protein [candidate division KSB1 bacterium]